MHQKILEALSKITEEEQAVLDGTGSYELLPEDGVMHAEYLMDPGRLFAIRPHTRFMHYPEHTHDYAEIVFMLQGTTTHIVNDQTVVLQPGEFLCLGAGARHEIWPASEKDIAVNLLLRPAYFDAPLPFFGTETTLLHRFLIETLRGERRSSFLHFRTSGNVPVQNYMENLISTYVTQDASRALLDNFNLGLLFQELFALTDTLSNVSREQTAAIKMCAYIDENFAEASLTEAAKVLKYDFFWLSHEIPNETGKTYTELLQEKRILRAAFLLKNTDMPVDEIIHTVGYENKSYFQRIFTAAYGVTPKGYRK